MIGQHLKLFGLLNDQRVEYLLIGGTLAIAYGVPRVTKDIDLFIRPVLDNAERCLEALKKMGMGTAHLTNAEDICAMEVTIFKDFLRVDVLTKVKGLDFDEVWKERSDLVVDDVVIHCLNVSDLIKSKKAAGRPGDLEDVKILEMTSQKEEK